MEDYLWYGDYGITSEEEIFGENEEEFEEEEDFKDFEDELIESSSDEENEELNEESISVEEEINNFKWENNVFSCYKKPFAANFSGQNTKHTLHSSAS